VDNVAQAVTKSPLDRASFQLRYIGQQYDADLNTLSLGGFALIDVPRLAHRGAMGGVLRIENALDGSTL